MVCVCAVRRAYSATNSEPNTLSAEMCFFYSFLSFVRYYGERERGEGREGGGEEEEKHNKNK